MENNFPAILKGLREKAGFESQTKFAEACGVDNSTIARLERGETKPTPKTLMKLAPVLKIDINELMIAAGYMTPTRSGFHLNKDGADILGLKEIKPEDIKQHAMDTNKAIEVPVIGTIKAEFNRVVEQDVLFYTYISRRAVGPGDFYYLKVSSDSMVDAGIKEGYTVLVKSQNFVDHGKIAVVIINGSEVTLKRVFYQDSQIILQSENAQKKYPPQILKPEDISILGEVIRGEFDV